ncbi:MAG: acyl carrier protein [Candidatus Babeliales bacterium]
MFEKNDTASKVITIVAETLNIEKDTISPESTFEGLGADSLDRLEIIMKLEETFGIDITDEQEANINSIQQAIDAIHDLRNK